MNRKELYEYLDIDTAEDFKYFENVAALFECDEEIDFADLSKLLLDIDKDVLASVLEEFFDDVFDSVPGGENDIMLILDNVRKALVGMCQSFDEELLSKMTEEFEKFRNWYSIDQKVLVAPEGTKDYVNMSIRDALIEKRADKLGTEKHDYDFSECADYELEEYVMTFGDLVSLTEDDE